MLIRFDEFMSEDFANVLSTVGMNGYGESISGYPVSNFATSTGYSVPGDGTIDGGEISASSPTDTKSTGFTLYKNKKRNISRKDKKERMRNQVGATIDELDRPVRKVSEGNHSNYYAIVVEVVDRSDCMRVLNEVRRLDLPRWRLDLPRFGYNERIDTLTLFPNWIIIEATRSEKKVYVNYWSDEGTYESNLPRMLNWLGNDSDGGHIYKMDDLSFVMRKLREFYGILERPNYTPRSRRVYEGEEALGAITTGIVGSGTKVGGGAEGSFVRSAGQALNGWDSGSAFGKQTNNSIDNIGDNSFTRGETPRERFKKIAKKKQMKDKQKRTYNKLGSTIDGLYKQPKKTINEDMKTWKEFTKIYEDGEGGSSAGAGGSSVGTLGNTGGMGAVVSAQPSSTPGDVAGGTKGSGDIGCNIGTFMKQPGGITQKRKPKNKRKKDKPYHRLGAGIDNFYRTNYVQSNSDGNTIQKWNAFTNEGNEYIIPVEPGRIYGVDSKKEGRFGQTLVDVYLGKNEDMLYKIGQLRTLGDLTIFYPEFKYIESGNLISVPLVDLKGDIRGLTEEEKAEVLEQLHKDKRFGSLKDEPVTYYNILKKMVGTELK